MSRCDNHMHKTASVEPSSFSNCSGFTHASLPASEGNGCDEIATFHSSILSILVNSNPLIDAEGQQLAASCMSSHLSHYVAAFCVAISRQFVHEYL
jgi:hypothetical protein